MFRRCKSALKKIYENFSRLLLRELFFKFQHLAFRLAFEGELCDWKPTIIHCNDWQTLSLGTSVKRRIGSLLVFDSHELETHRNPPLSRSRRRWMERYERKHLRQCEIITTVCHPISRYLTKKYGVLEPLVVENSPRKYANKLVGGEPKAFGRVDTWKIGNFQTIAERWGRLPEYSTLRSESESAESDFVLVMVGNITINRGVEIVLDALPLLPKNVKLVLLGKIASSFEKQIKNKIVNLGIEPQVSFLLPVNPIAVVDFIRTADLGLIPLVPVVLSYELALPNKLFECAFAGLPIVASDTYEVSRILKLHNLGTTFEAGDPIALADAIMAYYRKWEAGGSIKLDNSAFIDEFHFDKVVERVTRAIDVGVSSRP